MYFLISYCIYRTRQDTQVFIYIESSFRKNTFIQRRRREVDLYKKTKKMVQDERLCAFK